MVTAILRDEPGEVYDAATRQATVTSTTCDVTSPGVYSTKEQKINKEKSANRKTMRERGGKKFQLASWNQFHLFTVPDVSETRGRWYQFCYLDTDGPVPYHRVLATAEVCVKQLGVRGRGGCKCTSGMQPRKCF